MVTTVRYAYANSGNLPCNDQFSSQSIAAMSAAVADRGACFVESSDPTCGNGLIESNATGPTDTAGYVESDVYHHLIIVFFLLGQHSRYFTSENNANCGC